MSVLMIAVLALGLLAALFALAGRGAWRERRRVGSLVRFLAASLMFTLAALCATLSVSIRGYRAFTHEVVAATIRTEPLGPQQFRATVTLPDGRVHTFDLSGDAVYVDAHILKWRPLANVFGLHTAYELDRIAGRYQALRDEQTLDHTVQSIAKSKPFDLFELARRSRILSPLVDAEYGSATFIGASRPATFAVSVSTSGLLIRQVADNPPR